MDAWRTAIATSDATSLRVRGYDITALMKLSFADTIFLLHQGRLPSANERRLLVVASVPVVLDALDERRRAVADPYHCELDLAVHDSPPSTPDGRPPVHVKASPG